MLRSSILKIVLASVSGLLIMQSVKAQTDGVQIDYSVSPPTRNDDALLELNSTTQGMLVPRVTQTQRLAIAPNAAAKGLIVYQNDNTEGFYYWDGVGSWLYLASSAGSGFIENRTPNSVFGTGQTANFDVTGNGEIGGTLKVSGNVGIGVAAPTAQLHTSGSVRLANFANGFLRVDGTGNVSTASGSGLFTAGTGLSWSGTTLNGLWTAVGADIERQSGDVYIGDAAGTNNDLYISDRLIDWDNSTYYLDPGSINRLNEVMFDDGSASDVSIHFDGDANTGLYQPADNQIGFSSNGTESMRIDASRNILIGTTTASANTRLTVNNNSGAAGARIQILGTDATNATWRLATPSTGVVAFGGNSDHNVDLGFFDNGNTTFTSRLRVQANSGNVGIGTTGPTQKLHVSGNSLSTGEVYSGNTTANRFTRGTTAAGRTFDGSNGVIIENSESESGGFFANGNTAAIWSPGDNVGILSIHDEDDINNPRVVVNGSGDLEARYGLRTRKNYYYYTRTRTNGEVGTYDLGSHDICFLGAFSEYIDEDDGDQSHDLECGVWPSSLFGRQGDNTNTQTSANVDYGAKPTWSMYMEAYGNKSTRRVVCSAVCINFDY